MSTSVIRQWVDVCGLEDLIPERGVAALVGGTQVAVFRLARTGLDEPEVRVIAHRDPFTGANVLARGLVGSADGSVYVASPLHKQRFDLATGQCLDDPTVGVATWPGVVRDGRVLVGADATLE